MHSINNIDFGKARGAIAKGRKEAEAYLGRYFEMAGEEDVHEKC